jgi:hypothetical protein
MYALTYGFEVFLFVSIEYIYYSVKLCTSHLQAKVAMYKVCDKKKWLQHVSCVTRKDEEEKKRASKKRTYIHGKRKREKKEASDRMRNEQVEREMVKPCACMQRGNSCILYVRRLRFGM